MKSFLRARGVSISIFLILVLSACAQSPEELMARAREEADRGEYRTATIYLRNLLQIEPDNTDARLILGELALGTGETESAEKELKRARDLGADPHKVYWLLVQALFQLNKYQEAIDEIAAMSAAGVEMSVPVLLLRGYSYQRLGKIVAAERGFADVIEKSPDLPEGYAALAELMVTTGRLDRADERISEALSRDADYVPALLLQGRRLLATAGAESALDIFTRSVAIATEKADVNSLMQALILTADVQLGLHKLDDAAVTVARLGKVAPDNLLTRYLRARLAAQSEDNAEAIRVLLGVVNDYPGFMPARSLLGTVHFVEGNLEQAEQQLSVVTQSDPVNIIMSRVLAEVRLRQGRAGEVAEALKTDMGANANRANQELLILAGRDRLKQGDIKTALAYFRQGQKAFPEDNRFLLGEVTSYMSQGEPRKARALLESLRTEDKNTDAVALLSIMVHLQEEEFDTAIVKAEELVANQPSAMWARQFLGSVYIAAGKNDQARSQFDIVLKSEPENAAALIGMARIERRIGDNVQERDWLEKVRQEHDENITARLMLVRSFLAEGKGQQALEVAREAALKAPDQIEPASLQAMAAASVGEWEEAIAGFKRVVELDPDNGPAFLNLAQAYFRYGDEDSGQAAIDEALKNAPNNPRVLLGFGDREMALGEFGRAAATYRRVYEIVPNAEAAARLYRARAAAGEAEPLEYLDLWLADHPDDSASRYFRAVVYQEQGKRKESIAGYEKVLEQVPDQVLALNNLAWLYFEEGDSRALSVAQRAFELRPEWTAVADTTGWIYLQTGNLSKGLELLSKAVEESGEDPEVLYHLAVAQSEDGRPEVAAETLEKALALEAGFPSRADAQALLERLRS